MLKLVTRKQCSVIIILILFLIIIFINKKQESFINYEIQNYVKFKMPNYIELKEEIYKEKTKSYFYLYIPKTSYSSTSNQIFSSLCINYFPVVTEVRRVEEYKEQLDNNNISYLIKPNIIEINKNKLIYFKSKEAIKDNIYIMDYYILINNNKSIYFMFMTLEEKYNEKVAQKIKIIINTIFLIEK